LKSIIARIFPHVLPQTKKSPFFKFPLVIKIVETGPFPLSIFASRTIPFEFPIF